MMRGTAALWLMMAGGAFAATPDDPYYPTQSSLDLIGAEGAWDVGFGEGVRVAVIDTGVVSNHADGPEFLRADLGFDFVNQDGPAEDGNGYGTHIAGVIAAGWNNGVGIAGVAPAVEIVPVQVLSDQGQGSYAAVIAGIDHAVEQEVDIITLALGQPDSGLDTPGPIAVADAIRRAQDAGVLVVAAAGDHGGNVSFPALMPDVIAVGAVDEDLQRTAWSAGGANLDIVAPGTDIVTLGLTGYVSISGTAFATAQVAAAAALVWSNEPTLTATDVRARLLLTARDLGPAGVDDDTGHGLLRVGEALGLGACHDVEADLAEAERLLDECDTVLGEMMDAYDALVVEADELAAINEGLSEELGMCSDEAAGLSSDVDRLEENLATCNGLVASLELDLDLASGQVATLQGQIDGLAASLSDVSQQLGECRDDSSALELQLDACADSVVDLDASLTTCTDSLEICSDDLADTEDALADCEAEVEECSDVLLDCGGDNDTLQDQLDRADECLVAVDRLMSIPRFFRPWNPWGYTTRTFNGDARCDRIVTSLVRRR